jgi:putative restriction endonuclease
MERRNWSEEETLMAFALYFILPSGSWDKKNKDIVTFASYIGRTPDAVVFKLGNISSFDENRISQGLVGLKNASRKDKDIWEQYQAMGDDLIDDATSKLSRAFSKPSAPNSVTYSMITVPEGVERQTIVNQRVNQQYFRNTLLHNYGTKCCVTGIDVEPLLIASHIKPWSVSDPKTERLSPNNGLLLNALHDRAFDVGLITIDSKYRIHVSSKVKDTEASHTWLNRYSGETIWVPDRFPPGLQFIEYHNDVVFQR